MTNVRTMTPPSALPPFPDEGRQPSKRKMAKQTQIDHLASVALFAQCSKKELRHIAANTRLELLEPGQKLITEGDPSSEAFVLIAGQAVVRRNGRKVAALSPGDVIGELGLLIGRERVSTVIATTPIEVLVLERASLREVVDDIPGLAWKLLETVAERMADNQRRKPHD